MNENAALPEDEQQLIDEDYEEFYNSVAEQKEQDKKLYEKESDE
jgi:hypothetical protein